MTSYKELYFMLFGALEDAIELLERGENITAIDRMITAQQTAEEQVMELDIIPDEKL